jgi:hypothetical protein
MDKQKKTIVVDLNVFCHLVKDLLERRPKPLSTRYNMRAVTKAKEDLRLVRATQTAYSGDNVRLQLEKEGLPLTVKAANQALSKAKKLQSDEKSVIQACFVWLISGEWLGPLRDEHDSIIFTGDVKSPFDSRGNRCKHNDQDVQVTSGYWRHWYLMQPEVYQQIPDATKNKRRRPDTKKPLAYMTGPLHYKSGRKFPSDALGRVRGEVERLIAAKGYTLLRSRGDEADDHAALLVRLNDQLPPDRKRRLTLLTVDGDWCQLISPGVTWFCMHGYYPRIRANVGDLNRWKSVTGPNGSIAKIHRRYGADSFPSELQEPRDIIRMKALIGDESDSLPPGSPPEVIDLMNPPARFDLMNDYKSVLRAAEALTVGPNMLTDAKTVEGARRFLRANAVMVPVPPYDPT